MEPLKLMEPGNLEPCNSKQNGVIFHLVKSFITLKFSVIKLDYTFGLLVFSFIVFQTDLFWNPYSTTVVQVQLLKLAIPLGGLETEGLHRKFDPFECLENSWNY